MPGGKEVADPEGHQADEQYGPQALHREEESHRFHGVRIEQDGCQRSGGDRCQPNHEEPNSGSSQTRTRRGWVGVRNASCPAPRRR